MAEQSTEETTIYPRNVNTFAIPNDTALKRVHNVRKPSMEMVKLPRFIENRRLETLTNLCVAVLARSFGPHANQVVANNPLWLQLHYDSLDIDLPLTQCYDITEERFWKRLVLAKHKNKTLAIKPNVNWKNLGISLKYVELVEQCPAEYWPEDEMKELALKVKPFVGEMHIKRLQSLKERSFEQYFQSESESGTTSDESESGSSESSLATTSIEEETEVMEESEEREDNEKTESQLQLEKEMANEKAQRKKERQYLREARQQAREAKEAKRKQKEARRAAKEKPEKKPRKKIPDNLFDIQVSESEDDGVERIIDKRNKALLLRRIKKYNYPAKDCHHINLNFVQYFTNLEEFTIEFLGPIQHLNFHERHLNFSYDDVKHLAMGLGYLNKLKTFRLRNSRMDAEKLQIICSALGLLPCLETLDLGHDQLEDDCGFIFYELFQTTESLKNLELESNCCGEQVLDQLGKALNNYKANEFEYLGLARNPVTDTALHALVSAIIGTKHVQELNIRGLTFVTETGLCCCLANELLRQHPTLIKVDICAIRVSSRAANEIMKSLAKNENILEFYCCACELDEETEIDINVVLRRNKYISENYYLKGAPVATEEVKQWLNRTRNPILLKVLAERESHKQYLENQNDSKASKPPSLMNIPAVSQQSFLDMKSNICEEHPSKCSSLEGEKEITAEATQRSVYPANDFDEQQFSEPAPQKHYYHFKTYKDRYSILDDIKN